MTFSSLLHPASRFLMAAIFLASGAGKIFAFEQTAAMMSSAGFPVSELFLVGAIVLELSGGLGLLLGFQTRYATFALIMFVTAATIMFHLRFIGDPVSGQEQIVHALKNLAIIGGLVKIFADGAGSLSLDSRVERKEILI